MSANACGVIFTERFSGSNHLDLKPGKQGQHTLKPVFKLSYALTPDCNLRRRRSSFFNFLAFFNYFHEFLGEHLTGAHEKQQHTTRRHNPEPTDSFMVKGKPWQAKTYR
ncbi:MAG: hypothetical protein MK165_10650 [Pirellulaceae bacterium]|nr:hypothetical protein [Pirellulaceae bacterium]